MPLLHVPVIDLSPFYSGDPEQKKRVAREMDKVCRDIGFLVVTGHQVDPHLIKAVQDVSHEFLDLPESEKLKLKSPIDAIIRGYSPMMGEGLSFSIGESAPGDIKEIVTIGPPGASEARYLMGDDYYTCKDASTWLAPNVWPERPQNMRPLWEAYFRVMEQFAHELHQLCALALELPSYGVAPVNRDGARVTHLDGRRGDVCTELRVSCFRRTTMLQSRVWRA